MPITLTSRYKPLTYDEITRPLIEQTQAQEALENAYMEAQDQAAQLMAQANEQTDHDSYVKLKNYANAIQQQADALMQQGLNRNSRQSLLNLRRRYAQDIVPVANAAKRRQELYDERHKLRLTHPDMLQENEVISLDDLVRNPNMDLGATLYGSDLTKRAATLTNALARGKQSIALGRNLDKYTQTVLSQSGFTPEEIQAALTGNESPESIALRKLYSSTGVDNWKNAAAKQAVWDYIAEGAMQGVGDFRISTQRDAQVERDERIADRDHSEAFQAALYGMYKDSEGNWVYDPEHPGPKTKGKLKADGSADNVNDDDFEIVPKTEYGDMYRMKTDGTWWTKRNGKYYPLDSSISQKLQEQYVPASVRTESRIRLQEEPLYFGGDDFDVIRENGSSFTESEGKLISVTSLSNAAKLKLAAVLKEDYPGVKVTDVKIYKDRDPLSRNEYKIVIE